MSKLLVKILSICALVILLPLVVVGASLTVTEAVGCTLTVLANGDDGAEVLDGSVKILVNDKEQETNTITLAKHSEVTVVYDNVVGHDFEGWYEGEYFGDIQTLQQPLAKVAQYTFELTSKNTIITAVSNVRMINVTYQGFYDDGTEVDLPNATLKYGADLTGLNPKVGGHRFIGWKVTNENGDILSDATMHATFTSNNVILTAVWDELMMVTYMDGDYKIFTDPVAKNAIVSGDYHLPDQTNDLVKARIPAGYEFDGWHNANGKVESIDEFDLNGITLNLNKKLLVYNITVSDGAGLNFTGITYDVENGFVGLNSKVVKENYAVKQYKYNTVAYTTENLDDLAREILKSEDKNITLTVEWKLSKITLNVKFHEKSTETATIVYDDATGTFSKYNVTRDGYTLKALKYSGTEYNYVNGTYEGLGAALIGANQETVDVTAVWECEYEGYNFNFKAVYTDEGDSDVPEWNALVGGQKPASDPTVVQFTDGDVVENVEAKDLTNDIFKEYIGEKTVTKNDEPYDTLTFSGSVLLKVNGTGVDGYDYEFVIDKANPVLTYYKVLAVLQEHMTASQFAGIETITVAFLYE